MSGYGPVQADDLGLPAPRRRSPEPPDDATEAHVVSFDELLAGPPSEPLDEQALADLLATGEGTAVPGAGPALDAAPDAAPDAATDAATDVRPSRSSPGPDSDDSPTTPGTPITQTSTVWFWLWGPLLVAVVVVAFLAGMASAPVVLPAPAEARPATLLDVAGRTISTVDPPTSAEQLPAEQLPDLLLNTVVAVQDPAYWSRRGLAASDLLKAGAADLVRVRRQGTTLEERYARQVGVATGSTMPSLRESTVAARLSQRLSARALLVRYVNGLYFGNGVYGVGAASRFYFGRPVADLDPARIALLVAVADDPAHHNPVTLPGPAEAARQSALTRMAAAGLLTPAALDVARRVVPDARPHRELEAPGEAPDFSGLVEASLVSQLGDDAVYGQALSVSTPLDLDLQGALDAAVQNVAPAGRPPVLAVASDPRTGDVRALVDNAASSAGSSAAADAVLFTRRPIGSLATAFPAPLGDGTSASVGEVAAAFGAVADDGVRRDLRWVTSVTRPATSDRGREVLDVADPLPVGRPLLPRERADELTAAYRAATRRSSPQLSYSLTGVAGSAGADGWYVGCVPELCLTVWAGPTPAPAAGPVQPGTAVTPDPASLAARVVTDTLARYAAVAPDRVTLPFLPVARATTPSTSAPDRASAPTTATTPRPRPEVSGPPARATPAPRATSASPAPVAATPSPTPTPTGTTKANDPVDGGGTGGGGDPVAQGPALRTTPGSST